MTVAHASAFGKSLIGIALAASCAISAARAEDRALTGGAASGPDGTPAPQMQAGDIPAATDAEKSLRGAAAPEPQPGPADLPPPGARGWSVSAFAGAGYIYESASNGNGYYGGGVAAAYAHNAWSVRARYRKDLYDMDYYGFNREVVEGTTVGAFSVATPLTSRETKTSTSGVVTGAVAGPLLSLGIGWQHIAFENPSFSMTLSGPLVSAHGAYDLRSFRLEYRVEAAADRTGKVKSNPPNYVVFDGHETASLFGTPEYHYAWEMALRLPDFAGLRWSVGYEGTAVAFQYMNRYAHGVTVQAEFR